MRRFGICLMLFAIICVSVCACGNRINLTDVLIAEKWVGDTSNGIAEISFFKTGTGRFESPDASFDFQWEEINVDNCVRLNYEVLLSNGQLKEQTTDWEITEDNNIYTLVSVSGQGYTYVQESNYQKKD